MEKGADINTKTIFFRKFRKHSLFYQTSGLCRTKESEKLFQNLKKYIKKRIN